MCDFHLNCKRTAWSQWLHHIYKKKRSFPFEFYTIPVSRRAYVSVSHPIITSNHFKHISPTNFPMFPLLPLHSPAPPSLFLMRSWSWVTTHVFLTSTLGTLGTSYLSLLTASVSGIHSSLHTEGRRGKKKTQGRYRFSPRPVVWSEACRSHFHSPRPFPVHRHWSEWPWASVLVQVSPIR